MTIFLTISTIHILDEKTANEASARKAREVLIPLIPFMEYTIIKKRMQKNVKQNFCTRSPQNSDSCLAKSKL